MRKSSLVMGVIAGAVLGAVGTAYCIDPVVLAVLRQRHQPTLIKAGGSDRYEDYVMCTGAATVNPKAQTDGVWLLDYRGGKLMATVIDRNTGRINGWADLDL